METPHPVDPVVPRQEAQDVPTVVRDAVDDRSATPSTASVSTGTHAPGVVPPPPDGVPGTTAVPPIQDPAPLQHSPVLDAGGTGTEPARETGAGEAALFEVPAVVREAASSRQRITGNPDAETGAVTQALSATPGPGVTPEPSPPDTVNDRGEATTYLPARMASASTSSVTEPGSESDPDSVPADFGTALNPSWISDTSADAGQAGTAVAGTSAGLGTHAGTDASVAPPVATDLEGPDRTDAGQVGVDAAAGDATGSVTPGLTATVPMLALLAPGTVVGDRYTIAGLGDEADQTAGARTYRATDARSYEECWSCGSTDNGPHTRFCQNCGAPVQDHPVTLVQTSQPVGAPDEVVYGGTYVHPRRERRRFGIEGIGVEIGAHSAEGPHHPNEDSYWYVVQVVCANTERRSTAVAILCDGMGGYAPGSGLISSRIAAIAGTRIVAELAARADPELDGAMEGIVRGAIAAANTMVIEEVARTGDMGATLVAAVIYGQTAYLANIGDSRAYYVDPRGHAVAITEDQSLVGQQVRLGNLAEADMYTAPGSNIILHAVGEPDVQDAADWVVQSLEPGSRLILCSDGYWKTMRGAVVLAEPPAVGATLTDVAVRMVDTALAQASDDNTSVLLIAIG